MDLPPPRRRQQNPPTRWLLTLLALVVASAVVSARWGTLTTSAPAPPTPLPPPSSADRPPPIVETAPSKPPAHSDVYRLPLILSHYAECESTSISVKPKVMMAGNPAVWQPLTLSFTGPSASTVGIINPFLDYRLQVQFIAPSGRIYDVPGYFDGEGADGRGSFWKANFSADEPGRWRYCASFRLGPDVAVDLDPLAGTPVAFDGVHDSFEVAPADPGASDFFRWGRLEYVDGHYLKFRHGPYWLKGGTNSPENFLGYVGFHNAIDQGGLIDGFLHAYSAHIGDSRPDDPTFNDAGHPDEGRIGFAGIIGALNYLSEKHVNSIYFLPMNLGGDGQDTYPYLSIEDNTRFDVVKLGQWGVVLEHAQRRGIALHIVLNEVEEENRRWLDDGALGIERRLFYREMVARFAHLPAVKWNLSEEVAFTADELKAFAGYLAALDWADHPIAVHNSVGTADIIYGGLIGSPLFSATSMQFAAEEAGQLVETWRARTAESGRPWVIDMDENNPAGVGLTPDNAGQLRKAILYDAYFSGAAGVEWYLGYHELPLGGDLNLEDFRTREPMWDYMWFARRFLESLPFDTMSPVDELLTGESDAFGGGEVLALPGTIFAVYLPNANPSGVMAISSGQYELRWYDPRTGEYVGEAMQVEATADGLPLGSPPHSPDSDWVVLIVADRVEEMAPTAIPYP